MNIGAGNNRSHFGVVIKEWRAADKAGSRFSFMTDILLTHAYFLKYDVIERRVMKPYPPLGILYLSAYLKRAGFSVDVFDSTFRDPADFEERVRRDRPQIVGIYAN